MTDLNLEELAPEPIGIPDHTRGAGPRVPLESSGESGAGKRPGIFGRQRAERGRAPVRSVKPKTEKEAPPKLSAGMKKQLEQLYAGIGAMIKPFDELTGDTLIEQAPRCAETVYDLAQSNDAVRRFIISLTTTSAVGAVIMAHLPIFLALARHSKNERIKTGAGMAYVGLKMSDKMTVEDFMGSVDAG